MDDSDKLIIKNELATQIGRAVNAWLKRNDIESGVIANAVVTTPTLYVDDNGISHTGALTIIDIRLEEDDDIEEDDD